MSVCCPVLANVLSIIKGIGQPNYKMTHWFPPTGHKVVESTLFQWHLSTYWEMDRKLDLKKGINVNCCFEGGIESAGLWHHCNDIKYVEFVPLKQRQIFNVIFTIRKKQ